MEDVNNYDTQQPVDFENENLKNENLKLTKALTSSTFQGEDETNLIQYQLETDKILERIEHFLKGDQIKFNKDGSYYSEPTKDVLAFVKKDDKTGITYYIQEIKEHNPEKKEQLATEVIVKIVNKKGEEIDVMTMDSQKIINKLKTIKLTDGGYRYISIIDEDKKPLNEYGVAELMRIMSMYITKETFLSYYSEERINEILGDLGDAVNNFLYCNYEKMGMDTKFKESKYSLITINLLHVTESCYRRALDGAEQEHLRTRAIVTQNQGGGNNLRRSPTKEKWNMIKPSTW